MISTGTCRWACQPGPVQAQHLKGGGSVPDALAADAVGEIAQLAGYPEGREVVGERLGDGELRAQAGEAQVQDGGAHLGAEALALVPLAQPGPRVHLTQDSEVAPGDTLGPDDHAAEVGDQVQRPVARGPPAPLGELELQDASGPLLRRHVGPGHPERHHTGIVDALGGQAGQLVQFRQGGQAHLQPRGAQPQAGQWPVGQRHAADYPGGHPGRHLINPGSARTGRGPGRLAARARVSRDKLRPGPACRPGPGLAGTSCGPGRLAGPGRSP